MSVDFKFGNNTDGVDMSCYILWSDNPPQDQLENFQDLLKAWQMVGMFGEYGGHISYLGDIKTEGNKFTFYLDMGTANNDKAFKALRKLLEQFNDVSKQQMLIPGTRYAKIEKLVCAE